MDSFNQEDTFQWRGRARIVAYVDLVFSSMGLLLVIILALGASMVTVVAMDPNVEGQVPEQEALALSAWVLWILVIIAAALTFAQLWAAIKLLKGTDLGMDYTEALKNVGIWRKATIVFFVCQIIGGLIIGSYKSLIFGMLVRGIFLYIVQKFMEELKYHTQIQGPTGVTVKN